jgi:hypothetical protein
MINAYIKDVNMGMGGNMHEFNPARKMLSLDNHIYFQLLLSNWARVFYFLSIQTRVLYGQHVPCLIEHMVTMCYKKVIE